MPDIIYKVDFSCNDEDDLQHILNDIYGYKDDISTKVLHRDRMNLFYLLMQKLIREHSIKSFDSAIDIGCNAGMYSKMLSDFGFRYVLGIDTDPEMIRRAKNTFAGSHRVLEYEVADAKGIDTQRKYDFVLCTEVIEHVDDPEKLIGNIKAILTPGGVALITLPNAVSIPYLLTALMYRIRGGPVSEEMRRHLVYPFYRSLALFGDMKIVETSGTNLVFLYFAFRFLYKTPIFGLINYINFSLSRMWPFKYITQFFFIVLRRQ